MNTPSEACFNFISGLPRSGSTLLAALLQQNPRFHAGMTSPVATLYKTMIASVSAGSEMAALVTPEQRRRITHGLFQSYYADLNPNIDCIFDTSRSWTAHLDSLIDLFPKARVICCVRNVAWVMDSLERQFRSATFENTSLFHSDAERSTVFSRTEALAKPNRLVGFPLAALTEALYGQHAGRLLIVDYDKLVSAPAQVMEQIYRFIDQPQFQHNFDSVHYDAPSFDARLGLEGLHKVHEKVASRPRDTILPPELFARFSAMNVWDTARKRAHERAHEQASELHAGQTVNAAAPEVAAPEVATAAGNTFRVVPKRSPTQQPTTFRGQGKT